MRRAAGMQRGGSKGGDEAGSGATRRLVGWESGRRWAGRAGDEGTGPQAGHDTKVQLRPGHR
eukprot:166564-Chlamydomonas_euryale.AAC.4